MKRPSDTKVAPRTACARLQPVPASTGGLKDPRHSLAPAVITEKEQVAISSSRSAAVKLVLQADRTPQQIIVERAGQETVEETDARMMLTPAVTDSTVLRMFAQHSVPKPIDATLSAVIMAERIAAVNSGDMSVIEGMLLSKAITLDAVANEYLRRASLQMGTHLQAMDTYTRLALKAQAQSRANLEALAEIKNPRPVYAKQTNIAHGSQQVNNSVGPLQVNNGERGPREEKSLFPNKLLEH